MKRFQEIERKFLVSDIFEKTGKDHKQIIQGFLNSDPERTVRVRISGEKAWLTVKGLGNRSGTTRFEWEKEIPLEDANALLPLCEKGIIAKTRYLVPVGNHVFEVDFFHEENEGLVVAEIELNHEDEAFMRPSWLGEEVTGQEKYYNSALSKKPYISW